MKRIVVDEWFWQVGADLHGLSEELSRGSPMVASRKCWQPKVDVIEEADRLLIRVDIAGIRGDGIQVVYVRERHSILVRGSRPDDDGADGKRVGFHQLEIYYGEFEREIKLPSVEIDSGDIRAHYRNGFLMISVPKQGARS